MTWLYDLFFSTSIAHSILILALTIAVGLMLSKVSIRGISFGIAWILFMGIIFSHFGMCLTPEVGHFAKELGLILFVYSIGLQVGPGFFSSLRKGGLTLNMLAASIVALGCITTYCIHLVSGESLSTMVGVLSGAVTNTPGLGAAQQTFLDSTGNDSSTIAMGYAVAYPLGVVGIIVSMIFMKSIFANKFNRNQAASGEQNIEPSCVSIKVTNPSIEGRSLNEIRRLVNRKFIVSRIIHPDNKVDIAVQSSVVHCSDILRIVTAPDCIEPLIAFFGEQVEFYIDLNDKGNPDMINTRIVVTKSKINGRSIGDLNIRSLYGVNITRVNRAEIDLVASPDLRLQIGDRVTVVGNEASIAKVADLLGNSVKRLNSPNLFPIFFGIFLGVLVGSIPFLIPGIPQPVKLGLAGGPLIVAILIGRFGPSYKIVTFTTPSANMMIREIGISIFLAAVGLGAGEKFVDTVLNGGYWWVLYGLIITVVPLLIVGLIGLWRYKLDVNTLMGLLSGSMTDPPALAFANGTSSNDKASVAYATVYPLTMFLRVLSAQILVLIAVS
ncbi:MAG: putative transporter [Mucinivorans sp.]